MEDREIDEAEALEQAELRKRLEETVETAKGHRTSEAKRPEHEREAEPEWKPPEEVRSRTHGSVFVRFVVFLFFLAGVWFLVQYGSHLFFRPHVEALEPVVPEGRIPTGRAVTVGVRMVNNASFDGSGFVVAALASGEEIQGPEVPITGHDTVFVPVNLSLPAGDHVFSLVAFSSWKGIHRLETYRGMLVWVGDREIELGDLELPSVLQGSDTLTVKIPATNPGDSTEVATPILVFTPPEGTPTELDGPATKLAGGGGSGTLEITIAAASLEPGRYSVQLLARDPDGVRIGQGKGTLQVEVGG